MLDPGVLVGAAAAADILTGRDRVRVEDPQRHLDELLDEARNGPRGGLMGMVASTGMKAFTVDVITRGGNELAVCGKGRYGFALEDGAPRLEVIVYPVPYHHADFRDRLAEVLVPAVDRMLTRVKTDQTDYLNSRQSRQRAPGT